MIEAGGGFRFATKTLQMRFGGPMAEADHFECDGAVQTFLPRAINYALAAAADFLQEFVIAKVSKHSWLLRGAFFIALLASGVALVRPGDSRLRDRPRPVSSWQAGQTPCRASAGIFAPHFSQTLVTVVMLLSRLTIRSPQ